jgi:3-deoxy-D-manno-octulosonic-acid transferase
MIVDKVGMLADLYAHADLAYVGAGFGRGVHSVIEPAVYSCAIAYGPNIHNLDEAVSMAKLGLSTIVNNANELANFYPLLDQPDLLKSIQEKTEQFVTQHKLCSQSLLNIIFSK